MKTKVLGIIGILWGSAVLIKSITSPASSESGNAAYESGQTAGYVIAALLIVGGILALVKKPKAS